MSKELDDLKKIAISIVEHFCTKEEPARTNYINEILNTDEFKHINKKLKALEEIITLYNKWLGNEVSDFEFFTKLNEIINKYDLLKEELL